MNVRWLGGIALAVWAGSLVMAQGGDDEPVTRSGAFEGPRAGAAAFNAPHETGNGRSCATCHRPEDHFGLTLATVEARYQDLQKRRETDPDANDPLFRSIDADDFDQDFTTLRTKALVRVVVPLADNVRLADDPSAREVKIFRAVPTVINAAITAPYQGDGHLATLQDQALAAMQVHFEITSDPDEKILNRIARFQQHLFSSRRVRRLAKALESGGPLPDTDPPARCARAAGQSHVH